MTGVPAMDNAYALVVGIAHYQRVSPLPQTVLNDAQTIHSHLIDPLRGGYPLENTTRLLDAQATQSALRQALSELTQHSTPDSTVFLYLSSHGGRIEAGPYADEYILPVDADYSSTEALAASAISGTEFAAALRAIPASKLIVAVDSCHSGGLGRAKDSEATPLEPGLSEKYYDVLRSGRGRAILASCRDTEYSWVLHGAQNSLFTEHLLGGLSGDASATDGFVRIFDVFEYLQPRVTAQRSDQHPIFRADLEENFPVALCPVGQNRVFAPTNADDFRYDAYVSYVDRSEDAAWVWETLVPRLEAANLRVAVSGDVEEPGVARVVGMERGIRMAKRTVVVLSDAYLADHVSEFENVLAQTMGMQEGTYRLLPVKIGPVAEDSLPVRLSMLTALDFTRAARAEREFDRLLQALHGPLPVAERSSV